MIEPKIIYGDYVMVIEDSPVDFEIISRAFLKSGWQNPVKHFMDGETAIEYLEDCLSQREPKGLPKLIILDLNMPGMAGQEILSKIKNHEELKKVPVIVITTSNNIHDLDGCYGDGANCYIRKPTKPDDYVLMIAALKDFWFKWVTLPGADSVPTLSD